MAATAPPHVDMQALLKDLLSNQPDYLKRFMTAGAPAPATRDTHLVFSENPLPSDPSGLPATEIEPAPRTVAPRAPASPASSDMEAEDDVGFTPVASKSQKRKLKAKNTSNPAKRIIASTAPAATAAPAPSSQTRVEDNEGSEDSPMSEERKEKVPPLFIREKSAWERMIPLIDTANIKFSNARSTNIGIKVQCPTSTDHRHLTALLRQENVGYHSYTLEEERTLRVVIRGLPVELTTERIKEDLLSQDLPVKEVHRMYNSRSKTPYELCLVILDLCPQGKSIFRIRSVCRLTGLRIETPRNRGAIGQCHRCQLYGHCARNCHARPRCVKCLGDHGTADCQRKDKSVGQPSCVLCQTEGHPANYRGCPKAPRKQRRGGKQAARKQAKTKPVQEKFVPAPAPAVNAWFKPAQPKPAAPAAPKASPPVVASPAPKAPTSSTPASGNKSLNSIISVIDTFGEVEFTLCMKKLNDPNYCRLTACSEHADLILAIRKLNHNG